MALMALQFTACKDENGNILNEEEVATQLLVGTWSVDDQNGVSLDNADVTSEFIDFHLIIDEQLNYTVHGLAIELSPWPASGSFTFSDPVTQLVRNDGLVITALPSVDGSTISMRFTFAENNDNGSGGRDEAIIGEWLFNLRKQ